MVSSLQSFFSTVLSSIFGQSQEEEGGEAAAASMSSRHHHHQAGVPQKKRGAGEPVGKPKAAAGADTKNRRVLGDIGNLVPHRGVEGKGHHPINRPVTRSIGARLLEDAQAARASAANKKPVAISDGEVGKGVKTVKQKVVIKPKPEEVIEISPDTDEETRKVSVSKTSSRKKAVHTLTSVLTARSKVACGVLDKTKDPVEDIDALDRDNQLAVTDYVEDIYKFYKTSEGLSRPDDYMGSQLELNSKMRAILADWLIEVHHKFELMPETLFLTMNIIDRYLSLEIVLMRELQLVGVSAMLIASKYEEIWSPEVNDFIHISDRAYSREQILVMEKAILNKLQWYLTIPTPYMFLVRFIKAAVSDKEMEHMTFFFAELGLADYSTAIHCPSMAAAAAVYAARCTLKKSPLWTETLKLHTGFSERELLNNARVLVSIHSKAPESKLGVVFKKYSNSQFGAVALHPPATELMEELKAATSV